MAYTPVAERTKSTYTPVASRFTSTRPESLSLLGNIFDKSISTPASIRTPSRSSFFAPSPEGVTPRDIIRELPGAGYQVAKDFAKSFFVDIPTRVSVSLAELPQVSTAEKTSLARRSADFIRQTFGVDKVETYQEAAQKAVSEKEGLDLTSALLRVGSEAVLDTAITGDLLRLGAWAVSKAIPAPKPAHQAAWEALGRPQTVEEAKVQYRALAHQLHPDKGGSAEQFSKLTHAWEIVKDQGIPKNVSPYAVMLREGAEALNKPISELFAPARAAEPFLRPAGLLPGYRPVSKRLPVGLSTEELEPIGRDISKLPETIKGIKKGDRVKITGSGGTAFESEVIDIGKNGLLIKDPKFGVTMLARFDKFTFDRLEEAVEEGLEEISADLRPLAVNARSFSTAESFARDVANRTGVSPEARIQSIPLSSIRNTDFAKLDEAIKSAKLSVEEANKIVGRTEDLIKAGRQIETPITVQPNQDGTFTLLGGNNRVAQALVNGQTLIPAVSNDFTTGDRLAEFFNKVNKPKTPSAAVSDNAPTEIPAGLQEVADQSQTFSTAGEFVQAVSAGKIRLTQEVRELISESFSGNTINAKLEDFYNKIKARDISGEDLTFEEEVLKLMAEDAEEAVVYDTRSLTELERALKEAYPIEEGDQALSEIFQEMEISQPGQRVFLENGEVRGIESTFPKWIPEKLRSKKLFNKVLGRLEISKLKFPEGNKPKQRLLFNSILDELDARLGIDTSVLRESIMKKYAEAGRAGKEELAGQANRRVRRSVRRAAGGGIRKRPPSLIELGLKEKPPLITKREDVLLRNRVRAISKGARLGAAGQRLIDRQREFLKKLQERTVKEMTKQARLELQRTIDELELKKWENLRDLMKLPTDLRKMSTSQLLELNEVLGGYRKGDEFLPVRMMETIDKSKLAGARTIREILEILAEKKGLNPDQMGNMGIGEFHRLMGDHMLARQHPFFERLVLIKNESFLKAESRIIELADEANDLIKAARKSRPRGIIERLIPSDTRIVKWLESDAISRQEVKLTNEELRAAQFMDMIFREYYDYLAGRNAEKWFSRFEDQYFPHVRRGLWEAFKEDGAIQAFKELWIKFEQDRKYLNILDEKTKEILPYEKWIGFAQYRSDNLIPTSNAQKAFEAYITTLEKARHLDEMVPEIMAYVHALAPRKLSPRGIELDDSLKRFVKEWINTNKGRRPKGFLIPGGKLDWALRSSVALTRFLDLALNFTTQFAAPVGEQVMNLTMLKPAAYKTALLRRGTKQGRFILKKYENFVGRGFLKELSRASNTAADNLMSTFFAIFHGAVTRGNEIFLLGKMTEAEFEAGEISTERLAELLIEMNKYRVVKGAESVYGRTSEGMAFKQYKSWAIPIVRATATNAKDLAKIIREKGVWAGISSDAGKELFYSIGLGVAIGVGTYGYFTELQKKGGKRTFVEDMVYKGLRDSMSMLGALDPTLWGTIRVADFYDDLSQALYGLVMLEEKGVENFFKIITPRAIKQLEPEEIKLKKGRGKPVIPPGLPPLPSQNLKGLPKLPALPRL